MSNQLALLKKDTVDVVADRIRQFQNAGEIHFPANYSPENALKAAWLTLQSTVDRDKRPVLQVCTKDSIANALLDMVVQGLSVQKDQGYFIAYGKQLTFMRSYFGTMAVTKRVTGAKDIYAQVVYEGDTFEYEINNGKKSVIKHTQTLGNIDTKKILGAYCTIDFGDGRTFTEIMTMDEIRAAWSMSQMWAKGQTEEKAGSTQDKFRQEMAKRTVINRTCKMYLNSSDDSSLVMQHFHRTDDAIQEAQVRQEIEENANREFIDVESVDIEEPDREDEQQETKDDNQGVIDFEEVDSAIEAGSPGF